MKQLYRYMGTMTTVLVLGACGGGGTTPVDTTADTNTPSTNIPVSNTPTVNTPIVITPTTPTTTIPKNGIPVVVATVIPTTTTQGEVVSFDGSKSSDADGDIVSYQWKEGSKVLSGAASFSTAILPIGTHTITLIVTDTDDETASKNVTVTINSASAEALRLMKTGQGTSYADFDDGYYKKGVTPDYSRASDVVTDHITGLQWQDDPAALSIERNWEEAQTYCSKLKLDEGRWRLPTRKELLSLTYYTGVSPAINPIFEYTALKAYYAWYFSSTVYASSDSSVWAISFYSGAQDTIYKYNEKHVRCVRNVK